MAVGGGTRPPFLYSDRHGLQSLFGSTDCCPYFVNRDYIWVEADICGVRRRRD
jgi:hypothetical protein